MTMMCCRLLKVTCICGTTSQSTGAALLQTRSMRLTFVIAAGLGVAISALALVVSYDLDLPAGPNTVALLSLAVPVAAMRKW